MKLLTQAIIKTLPKRYSQENVADPMVVCKFFTPWTNWTWYVLEAEHEDNDILFFGYVVGHDSELGYFLLSELQSIKHWTGLKIERDLYFKPTKLSEIKAKHS